MRYLVIGLLAVSCGGSAEETEEACRGELEPGVIYEETGCYLVSVNRPLGFAYFQSVDCEVFNNDMQVRSFTVWDELEPGTLVIEDCTFRMMLVPTEEEE